jgi:hypothetical protein
LETRLDATPRHLYTNSKNTGLRREQLLGEMPCPHAKYICQKCFKLQWHLSEGLFFQRGCWCWHSDQVACWEWLSWVIFSTNLQR